MKIQYFAETDTLYVVFSEREVVDSADVGENALVDFDVDGNVVALTLEHARALVDFSDISLKDLAAAAEPTP